jgi:hypothetical protein
MFKCLKEKTKLIALACGDGIVPESLNQVWQCGFFQVVYAADSNVFKNVLLTF